jgi:hypothetical protein
LEGAGDLSGRGIGELAQAENPYYRTYGMPYSSRLYAASVARETPEKPPRSKGKQDLRGPRGGETTRKPGRVKKTVWLHDDEAKRLREAAYEDFRSEASIIREALRVYFHIED